MTKVSACALTAEPSALQCMPAASAALSYASQQFQLKRTLYVFLGSGGVAGVLLQLAGEALLLLPGGGIPVVCGSSLWFLGDLFPARSAE